eukprot:TRINITY_DN782108_c0_g1_i1.p1 TRINITY_DN782108_c0_g1~~TRINITY_DN782108_c0_g1_i1.p1  ORF type:complete len:345 (-),score=69.82 TRINITY_DN782108_c0_g1_i1:172-1206(-)
MKMGNSSSNGEQVLSQEKKSVLHNKLHEGESLHDSALHEEDLDLSEDIEHIEPVETAIWKTLVAGGVAGAVSRTCTAPMDRLKVLLQAQGRKHPYSARTQSIIGMADGVKYIYKEGGWKGFFRGNGTNCIKIVPETAVRWLAFEHAKRIIAADPSNMKLSERFLAGSSAGVVAQVSIYPLEVIKTRMTLARRGQMMSMGDCVRNILKYESPLAFYRGLSASLMGIIPYAGVDLSIYSLLKDHYTKRYGCHPPIPVLLMCGGISTTCGQFVAYPLQLIRTRLQAQGMKHRPVIYKGVFDCFSRIVKYEGVFGLYSGLLPNFLKAAPAISISYAVYESIKRGLASI